MLAESFDAIAHALTMLGDLLLAMLKNPLLFLQAIRTPFPLFGRFLPGLAPLFARFSFFFAIAARHE
jgi:hypothetical protein